MTTEGLGIFVKIQLNNVKATGLKKPEYQEYPGFFIFAKII